MLALALTILIPAGAQGAGTGTKITVTDGVTAQMAAHQAYQGENGPPTVSASNDIRYGTAANSVTSGFISNAGGWAGSSWLGYSDGYSGRVGSGSSAYSAHGNITGDGGRLSLSNQSALGFAPAQVDEVEIGKLFNLGRMVHRNHTVQVAQEWYQGDLRIDLLGANFDYRWRLHETPNNWNPGSNPRNDDYVDFIKQADDGNFVLDGQAYTLVVHGFMEPGSSNVCPASVEGIDPVKNEFRTTEGRDTYGCLYASVEQVRELTVTKVVETPHGDPGGVGQFSFTAESTVPGTGWGSAENASFTLGNGESRTAGYVSGGDLTFTEGGLEPGWELTGIACTDGRGDPLGGVKTDLAAGRLVVPRGTLSDSSVSAPISCVFTNTYVPRAQLTLVKHVVSDGQPAPVALPEHWDLSATGEGAVAGEVLTGTNGVTGSVIAGEYLLSESPNQAATTAGYTAGPWSCAATDGSAVEVQDGRVTIAQGQDVTCSVTNEFSTGALAVTKALDAGVPEGSGAIPFSGEYRCELDGASVASGVWSVTGGGDATLSPDPGSPAADRLPLGAVCSASEAELPVDGDTGLPDPSWQWGDPEIGDPVTIELGETAQITVTNTVRREFGSVAWVKTGEDRTPLAGSEWELTGPDSFATEHGIASGEALVITDCESAPCTGPDADPETGSFLIERLPVGEYSLGETRAPAGHSVIAVPVTFTVARETGGTQQVELGEIVNPRRDAPELPLTGGIGRDAFTIAGFLVLGGGSAAGLLAGRGGRKRVQIMTS